MGRALLSVRWKDVVIVKGRIEIGSVEAFRRLKVGQLVGSKFVVGFFVRRSSRSRHSGRWSEDLGEE